MKAAANAYQGREGGPNEQIREVRRLRDALIAKLDAQTNAILVIDHSPHVDWLLYDLVRPQWPLWSAYSHSFANGEIVCVRVDRSPCQPWRPLGHPIWSLAPTDNESEAALRDNIKGKMESAKLLGGIVAAGMGFTLAGFRDLSSAQSPPSSAPGHLASAHSYASLNQDCLIPFAISIILLMIATALYCFAYLSYDRLLMPKRFWATIRPPNKNWRGIAWRPPSSSVLILHQNMLRVWNRAFIPATAATGLALLALAYAATIRQIADALEDAWEARVATLSVITIVVAILAVWHRAAQPVLGAQD
jgi:hypothetical protein